MIRLVIINVFLFLAITWMSFVGCERESISPDQVDLVPPLPPTGLIIEEAQDGYIFLSWKKNSERDILEYIIYRSEGNQNSFYKIDSTQNFYLLDEHLSYDTTYFYYVTAVDISGNQSKPSTIISSQSSNKNAPQTPKGFEVNGHNSSSGKFIQLSWTPNNESDLAGYKIYRSTQTPFTAEAASFIIKTDQAFYRDTTIHQTNARYYYGATAIDRGGKESPLSPIQDDVITEIPVLISPESNASVTSFPKFIWQNVSGSKKYKVTISTSEWTNEFASWFVDQSSELTISSSYQGPYLNKGRIYYWRIATITSSENNPNAISDVRSFQIVN